ncbi:MAG: NAD(P)-binding domain-containing protein, partial [Chloroflexota bacterium]
MAIGFIGTGIMGSRMAINLLKNGHDVIVHNRTQANAQPVIDAGATWAETPADVAQQTDIVFTMLAHPNAVESVALGENGLLSALSEGNLWVHSATIHP